MLVSESFFDYVALRIRAFYVTLRLFLSGRVYDNKFHPTRGEISACPNEQRVTL
jgi:hypothetical protein